MVTVARPAGTTGGAVRLRQLPGPFTSGADAGLAAKWPALWVPLWKLLFRFAVVGRIRLADIIARAAWGCQPVVLSYLLSVQNVLNLCVSIIPFFAPRFQAPSFFHKGSYVSAFSHRVSVSL